MKKIDPSKLSSDQKHILNSGKIPLDAWYEQLYHMLLASLPFSLVLIDRNFRITSANSNFLKKSRRTQANTIGATIRDVFPSAILDFARLEIKIRNMFETGLPLQGAQMTYRAPGIPTRIYYYTMVPVMSGLAVQHAMLVMEDITEKVQLSEKARMTERHLASVVESANDLVASTGPDGRIMSWNIAAERISGYHSDEVCGWTLTNLCEATQQDRMIAIIRHLATGDTVKFEELNLVARNGAIVPVDFSFSPIRDDSGTVSGIVAVGRDLSERRAFEKHIFQSEKLAALGVMAGGIAHELRNPMSVSFSAGQFLLDETIDKTFQRECVEKVINGIQQASAIIENLLRFARPSPSEGLEHVELADLMRRTVDVLIPQAKLHKIKLLEDYDKQPITLLGNSNLLQQVVLNLILNAFQATPAGGVVTVTSHTDGQEAIISVCDKGCGISVQHLAKIFDPFFTTQPVGKGTGLGLSICYNIVKQHGGQIGVESIENEGSTFTIRLPIHQQAAA
jgi:PAS domain S-box-containing protein